ncbi:uncharacterized protein LOC128264595 isoform X1 [Drosophila gunungcola]|uniref:Uncharacterized protein n=1 Tax=Drosophila gunungcola TaxID=103775 RepID=A0A9P9YCJ8_9MUSC|nr:uncharacterized protein LOC128264595 isoform X1 [Drosophila gunungcola]KAI8034333.1 hypothetical protein M5D96_012886 [Drosophila gunungcola]
MRHLNAMIAPIAPILGLLLALVALVHSAPVEVVYTGESCACPTQLGYQLNVPNPPKQKKYAGAEYGYRVEKPVQTKAKISYSFDFTVEQPRTPAPPKTNPSKLYAKVDRITVNKADCQAKNKSTCSCSSCASQKPRYVAPPVRSPNAIRRRRDLRPPGSLLRRRLMRQQQLQDRPPRYVKLYSKDLTPVQQKQQQQLKLFGLIPVEPAQPVAAAPKTKRKTKKTQPSWMGLGRRLHKRDIKGEYDLLEQDRSQIDLTAPEIIQFMPETLNPNFKRGQCHMGCGAMTAAAPPPEEPQPKVEQVPPQAGQVEQTEPLELQNTIPAKRAAAFGYYPVQIPSPLSRPEDYKFVDDSQLSSLLSTTSVPDPLEYSSTPLQFAGDLESVTRRSYGGAPLLGLGGGYPVEHVTDSQLDSIISGIVYNHPAYDHPHHHYHSTEGTLVDPEPVQKQQTTDFLKKLIDGRLGGWGFDQVSEPEQSLHEDYARQPAKTYGYNSHTQNGYSVDTYSAPPITDYLRAWF